MLALVEMIVTNVTNTVPDLSQKRPAPTGMAFLNNGAPERIRTSDPQIRSLVLYPAELRAPVERGT